MNKKGSVLMITLWIVALLVIFVLGLGHRGAINLRLARYQRDRLRANFLAKAGVNKVIDLIKQDAQDPLTKDYDSQDSCGVNLQNKAPEEVFKEEIAEAGGSFKAGYTTAGGFVYGPSDEERRININSTDIQLLTKLFSAKINDAQEAAGLANAVKDWISATVQGQISGQGQPSDISKKEILKRPEELLLILENYYVSPAQGLEKKVAQQKAQGVYNSLKEIITVYGDGKINVNTASVEVLSIFAQAVVSAPEQESYAQTLAEEIVHQREVKVGKFFANLNEIILPDAFKTTPGETLFNNLLNQSHSKVQSDYFRIQVMGSVGDVDKNITAIFNRKDDQIVYWHEI